MYFGDCDPADAFDADDGHLHDWALVEELQRQIDRINAIDDDAMRLLAARKWAVQLYDEGAW